jgi:heat shock protein HslJ
MKHCKLNILLLMLCFELFGLSCTKVDTDIDLTAHNWKVEKIRKNGQLTYTITDSIYILRFISNSEYNLDLDVNMCSGLYEIPDQGKLEIQPMACTEVCCDSEFAEEMAFLLPRMTEYYGKDSVLYLEGDGKIVLQPN